MVQVILLAAGLSRRFPGNKLLQDWKGKPVYAYALQAVADLSHIRSDCHVTVVTRVEEIANAAQALGLQAVINEHPERGISSSMKLGLQACPQAEWYLCSVADQPEMTGEMLHAFLSHMLSSGAPLGCVSHEGIPGNPALFHRRFLPELMAIEGDKGGRVVLERHRDERLLWEGPSLFDVDTPDDLNRI